ncbi:rod shape-determining protein [Actinomadura parmotrematis]|uniref:Rod shape-determining protein n=1 Tax=Actinomadura parmotrematis TaxID=2864039 RepID=A0ABS7G2D6_9ACTN|nr:rod shape-determining protein [Actinomadura parmotrematis]MBW8486873.1 rod shape-determining protein [Actinomadura parmotrematis]
MHLRDFPGRSTAIDLGSATVRVHVAGRGIVAAEPAALARCTETGRVLAIGRAAVDLAERRRGVRLVRPVRGGVPAEPDDTEAILRRLLRHHHRSRYLARPRMAITAPSLLTPLQREAVCEAAFRAGARKLTVVPKPLAAALGAGLPGPGSDTAVVADIGAHVTDVGLITFGGLAGSATAPVGGADLDRAIVSFVRTEHRLHISAAAAERVKTELGALAPRGRRRAQQILVHGRDVRTGLPRAEVLAADDVHAAIAAPVDAIVEAVTSGLASCSPDMAAELVSGGLTLTGGTAALRGLDRRVHEATGLPVRVAADPADAAVKGAAAMLALGGASPDPDVRSGRRGSLLPSPPQPWPVRSL